MNSNFRSYFYTVDFEGVEIQLASGYKYITRDEFGMVQQWIRRPKKTEFGVGDGSERPIICGHQKGEDLEVVIRKYRIVSNHMRVTFPSGAITNFRPSNNN